MRINESRIRQIVRDETRRALREGLEGSAAEEDGAGRWTVDNNGYNLEDAPRDVSDAWYEFTIAVANLADFMNDEFPDTEADGEPLTIGDAAVHQAQTFLTGR